MADTETNDKKISPTQAPALYMQDAMVNNLLEAQGSIALLASKRATDFFANTTINESYWNQALPYQLQVVDASLGFKTISSITLPITPNQIDIQMPIASQAAATFGGIVEEHGGAPFRIINIRASFGVAPLRPSTKALSISPSSRNFIAAGTVAAVGDLVNKVRDFATQQNSTQGNVNVFNRLSALNAENDNLLVTSTGFFQSLLMRKFIENYVAIKQTKEGKNLRLAFARFKENSRYLCTIQKFDVSQSASSPLETMYSITLKAWARLQFDTIVATSPINKKVESTRGIIDALVQLQKARKLVLSVQDVALSLRSDINTSLFSPLRESILFCKDTVSTAMTLFDLPANIILDFKSTVVDNWSSLKNTIQFAKQDLNGKKIVDAFDRAFSISQDGQYQNSANQDSQALEAQNSSQPVNDIFKNPNKYNALFDQINVQSLPTPPALMQLVNQEIARVKKFDYNYFSQQRTSLQDLSNYISNMLGIGSNTYNSNSQLPTITKQREPTKADYQVLYAINEAMFAMDTLALLNRKNANTMIPNNINYIAGLAAQSNIDFAIPSSKFAIPFPYGSTMESVAQLYLGDSNRALEIITLNGLKTPYIDEEGFYYNLSSNGNGNRFYLDTAENLYVGQQVVLSSLNVGNDTRHITQIQKTGNTFLISVDGADDLSKLTTAQSARIRAFLPNTVNSQKLLYIPSFSPAQDTQILDSLPGVNNYDGLLNVGGVSLLLDSQNRLIISKSNGTKWAFGLSNLIQAARIGLATPQGGLILHPEYGVNLKSGSSNADSSAQDLLNAITQLFKNDPRFSKVLGVSAVRQGPVTRLNLSVQVTGTNHTLPLSIEISQ